MDAVIGIGLDVVDVERMRTVLSRRAAIKERLFTRSEQHYAEASIDSVQRFAARFAAKEAVMKALGVGLGSVKFRDIEVVKLDSGKPTLELHGQAAVLADLAGIRKWHLSMSHTALVAEAIVVAE
ncbi:MAG: holo-[acyl-carrier protein] synthase [Candidatus Poriferisodalaceae bacterium]|nr:holo-ACP synthase [Acidimicrobiales bacterium]